MTRTLLVYGDSNTHGTPPMPHLDFQGRHAPGDRWPDVMAAGLPGWAVIAEGLPGRTTVHDDPLEGAHMNGLSVLPALLHSHKPLDLVIVKLGTNDLKARYNLPAQDVTFGAGKLVECIRWHQPQAGILLVAPPPIRETGCLAEMFGGGAAKSARFGALYAAEAARQGAAFLNAGSLIAVDPLDGIHYDTTAHHMLGEAVADFVRALWP